MATHLPAKIVVTFEHRVDGGLRAYSDDVPSFFLSHSDRATLLSDVKPALERTLSYMLGSPVVVEELFTLHEQLAELQNGPLPTTREYVAHRVLKMG